MRAVLKTGNYRMLEAIDAETGLRLVREHRPDLILMDIQLPGMDGLSATKIIKTDPDLNYIPIFALTGFAMENDKEKAWISGLPVISSSHFLLKVYWRRSPIVSILIRQRNDQANRKCKRSNVFHHQ